METTVIAVRNAVLKTNILRAGSSYPHHLAELGLFSEAL